jgi:DNA-binding NtrC family response regulator
MPTILIVDDDDAIRAILYDLLCEKYECDTASMAEEALNYLEVEDYDAILTDLAMPGLGGVALLKKIQETDSATPVILISGKGAEQDPQDLLDLGAFAFVNKPFNLDEIEEVVERAVGQTVSGA